MKLLVTLLLLTTTSAFATNLDDFENSVAPQGVQEFGVEEVLHQGLWIFACQYVGPETECADFAAAICEKFHFTDLVSYQTVNVFEAGLTPQTPVWKLVRNTGAPSYFEKIQGGILISGKFLSGLKCSK